MPDMDDVEAQIDYGHQECLTDFAHHGYRGKIGRCERHNRLMVVEGHTWYKDARNMHWWVDGPTHVRIASRLVREEREREEAERARTVGPLPEAEL